MGRPPAIGAVQLSTGTPRVVAAGGEAELDALTTAAGADVVELRADLFEDPRPETVTAALVRLRAAGRPIILTVRAAAEGGRPLDEARRHALYTAGLLHVDAARGSIAPPSFLPFSPFTSSGVPHTSRFVTPLKRFLRSTPRASCTSTRSISRSLQVRSSPRWRRAPGRRAAR